ncbi:hypothetical protein TNCV_2946131 [Trichonephila clavipes]|nr:hypothetical protein TNCV_2946131 [Trichonephila clavipes]
MNSSLSQERKMVKSRLPRSSEWRFNLFLSFPFHHQPSRFFHSFLFHPSLFRSCRVEMVTFQFSGSFPAFFPQPFYGRNRISSIRTGPEIRQGIVLFASDRPGSIRGTSKLC